MFAFLLPLLTKVGARTWEILGVVLAAIGAVLGVYESGKSKGEAHVETVVAKRDAKAAEQDVQVEHAMTRAEAGKPKTATDLTDRLDGGTF